MAEEIKVAILEQKIEDLKHIVVRIDTAIEKLGEVNSNVSRMLAVHEERITKQEEVDSILFAKIDKLRDKNCYSSYQSIVQNTAKLSEYVYSHSNTY